MRTKIIGTVLFLASFVSGISGLNAQNNEVVIQIDTLSDKVYMLTGQGGNIGIYVGERLRFYDR